MTFNAEPSMMDLARQLYPIQRSLAGPGNRESLRILSEHIPELRLTEVATGTKIGEWTVPSEWAVRAARLTDPSGRVIADVADNNLHLVGYSTSVDKHLSLDELRPHLHSFPELPEAVPYVTSYYRKTWGFCLSDKAVANLKPGQYHVLIDTEFVEGSMTIAEAVYKGNSEKEVLISTYICHPQMMNNEISGPVVATQTAKWVSQLQNRHFTYRFVIAPETIGSITYISQNLEQLKQNLVAGYVLTCIGDERGYSYVESISGITLADRIARRSLHHIDPDFNNRSFLERGSDERQYNSPGVALPVGTLSRSGVGNYPEYHTSHDDHRVVTADGLEGGYRAVRSCIERLEQSNIYSSDSVGEPFLSAYGLYPTISRRGGLDIDTKNLVDVFAYSDGSRTMEDIADDLSISIESVDAATKLLENARLISRL